MVLRFVQVLFESFGDFISESVHLLIFLGLWWTSFLIIGSYDGTQRPGRTRCGRLEAFKKLRHYWDL